MTSYQGVSPMDIWSFCHPCRPQAVPLTRDGVLTLLAVAVVSELPYLIYRTAPCERNPHPHFMGGDLQRAKVTDGKMWRSRANPTPTSQRVS